MSSVRDRLSEAGHELPQASVALGSYVPAVRVGELVFTSGQLPMRAGELMATGVVGADVDVECARSCAEQCALNALAAAATVCDLGAVERVVKVTGYVASAADFTAQPAVVDGASELLALAFGEDGRHAREAVGVAALPLAAPVEVSIVLRVRT
ncbi:MAG TPA: RidA family protein [Coriobacteriia bacterium]|nr:RidA family protein [Coriobacteriia bacterium]